MWCATELSLLCICLCQVVEKPFFFQIYIASVRKRLNTVILQAHENRQVTALNFASISESSFRVFGV